MDSKDLQIIGRCEDMWLDWATSCREIIALSRVLIKLWTEILIRFNNNVLIQVFNSKLSKNFADFIQTSKFFGEFLPKQFINQLNIYITIRTRAGSLSWGRWRYYRNNLLISLKLPNTTNHRHNYIFGLILQVRELVKPSMPLIAFRMKFIAHFFTN